MAAAIVDNNIPFAAADTFSPLFKEMFPDSEIAKSYASARTKTTCIVNGALKPYFRYVHSNVTNLLNLSHDNYTKSILFCDHDDT